MESSTQLRFSQVEQSFLVGIAQYGNFILVFVIASVLAMMMIPLPSWLLDLLLAVNVMGSLGLLLVVLLIGQSLQLVSFPSLLLLSTLFRLGLNIASTRLILTHGEAGQMIEAFGAFATGGNLGVGFIMFVIVTLIQFIVMAKGSERVAEVAARFTLDALPGKQMSIDADLRAGLISQSQAKEQRENLQKESRLYGAMDGAMKFVKGDTIAGILITLINILGGLVIGMSSQGMSFDEAWGTYTQLAIGDGLVSQMPALLISLSAGMMVTRVASSDSGHSLGQDLGQQILAQPKALLMASGFAWALACIPGFPSRFFLILGSALLGFSFYLLRTLKKKLAAPLPLKAYAIESKTLLKPQGNPAQPLVLEVGPQLYQSFQQDSRWLNCFGRLYPKVQGHLRRQLGICFPPLKLFLNPQLKAMRTYRIRIWDVPVQEGTLMPNHCGLLGKSRAQKTQNPWIPEQETYTTHGTPLQLFKLTDKSQMEQQGLKPIGPEEILLRQLVRVLKKHGSEFVGIQEVYQLVQSVEVDYPELVHEVVPKQISMQKLTQVVQRLVEEEISIKDFRLILQSLALCAPAGKDPVTLTETVRMGLKRQLTFRYVSQDHCLNILTLSAEWEEEIRQAIHCEGDECYLVLAPHRLKTMTQEVTRALKKIGSLSRRAVILTQPEIRRYVRKIIESKIPWLPVLSFQELEAQVKLNNVGILGDPLEAKTLVVGLKTNSPEAFNRELS